MIIIGLIITAIYVFHLVRIGFGFTELKVFDSKSELPKTRFSIIIPFRNEEKNLPDLIDSLKNIDFLPPDIDNIVLTHHENATGSGFPRKLNSSSISPIACVFILANEITIALMHQKDDPSQIRGTINYLITNYNVGNFKKPLEGVIKLFPVQEKDPKVSIF